MIWADKFAIFWAVAIAVLLGIVHSGPPAPAYADVYNATPFFEIMGVVLLKVILPLWLVLRGIDWLIGGPSRRRGQIRAHIV